MPLPQKPQYTALGENHGKFEISGCYPGYGTTLGNALRRVLLSSLEGAAVKSIKIKNISHEFSTLPGVLEDIVQIILNIKKVRFRVEGDLLEPVRFTLKAKGEGVVTAKAIKTVGGITVVNTDHAIATLTDKKAELEIELEVDKGLGYVPVEQQVREEKEIGLIAVDAIYTPIKRVNYEVENMRVGKRTDFEKITLEIVTDGCMTPEEAFDRAAQILVEQCSALLLGDLDALEVAEDASEAVIEETDEHFAKLPARVRKSLSVIGVTTLKQLSQYTEDELGALDGMGEKAVQDIKKVLVENGLSLK
jgi:DNA-directed RNA polymerase subunit alpha